MTGHEVLPVLLDSPCDHPACQRRKRRKEMRVCECCHRSYWTGRVWCWAAIDAVRQEVRHD